MSVFDQETDKVQIDLIDKILDKYDINDVNIEENPETHLRADRILYVINKVKSEVNELNQLRDESIEFYNNEIDKKSKNINYLEGMLEYFIDNEGKKTINLPNGTLKMRTTKNFKYPDHDILLEFCKERDIPVVVTEKPNLSVVKKYIKTTGESPEGMEILEVTSFSYTTKEGH